MAPFRWSNFKKTAVSPRVNGADSEGKRGVRQGPYTAFSVPGGREAAYTGGEVRRSG